MSKNLVDHSIVCRDWSIYGEKRCKNCGFDLVKLAADLSIMQDIALTFCEGDETLARGMFRKSDLNVLDFAYMAVEKEWLTQEQLNRFFKND
jgi:hypothetical protein